MGYTKEDTKSLYDYSDMSVQHAGFAAVVYAAMNLFGTVLAWLQYFLYHRPGTGAAISGVLAFFIFRRS